MRVKWIGSIPYHDVWFYFLSFADVLGHPFGKVPLPRPFDGDQEEAKVILSDPTNPVGKEMLASKI